MFENIEGVVTIGGDLYVKTPEALETLLKELHETDYEVDDLRAWHQEKRFTVEMAEKNGWALWHVHLARQGKCGSCGGLISPHDIETHGHTCELCGAVTFLKITDGSRVQFSFKGEEELRNNISMKAQRWDTESGYLYLFRGCSMVRIFSENKRKTILKEIPINGRRFPKMVRSLFVFGIQDCLTVTLPQLRCSGFIHTIGIIESFRYGKTKSMVSILPIVPYPEAWVFSRHGIGLLSTLRQRFTIGYWALSTLWLTMWLTKSGISDMVA